MPLVRIQNIDCVVQAFRELGHGFAPVGEGNVVSLEFNLLYRWHATLSEKDTVWTETAFNEFFEGKDLSKVNPYRSLLIGMEGDKILYTGHGPRFQGGRPQVPHPARECQNLDFQ